MLLIQIGSLPLLCVTWGVSVLRPAVHPPLLLLYLICLLLQLQSQQKHSVNAWVPFGAAEWRQYEGALLIGLTVMGPLISVETFQMYGTDQEE